MCSVGEHSKCRTGLTTHTWRGAGGLHDGGCRVSELIKDLRVMQTNEGKGVGRTLQTCSLAPSLSHLDDDSRKE